MEGDTQNAAVSVLTGISIHSLRMEGDFQQCRVAPGATHFNPLPPYGGRHPAIDPSN